MFHDGGRGTFSGTLASGPGHISLAAAQALCTDMGNDGVVHRGDKFHLVSGLQQSLASAWTPSARGVDRVYWSKCTSGGRGMAERDVPTASAGGDEEDDDDEDEDEDDDDDDEEPWPGVAWQTRFALWHNRNSKEAEEDAIPLVAKDVDDECDKAVDLPWDLKLVMPLVKWLFKGRPNPAVSASDSDPDPDPALAAATMYGSDPDSDPVTEWLPDYAKCRK
jgi:hypothetical protein